MKSHHQVALSLLTLCISQQLYAQTDVDASTADSVENAVISDMPSTTLDTITVTARAKTGTALAQKISEMPAVTQVIGEEDIQAQATGNRTTGDILAQLIPSLGASSGSTSNYGTTMRGRPVQYLLNGVPLSGSRSLSRELNSIDPAQLERVEVLSGATSIYGSGAAGGLINLVTKSAAGAGFTGQTRLGIDGSREFESDSLGYHVGQSLGYGGERVYGRLDVDYASKGGKFDSHGDRISPDVNQTDQQDTESLSVNANLGMDIDDSQSVNLAVTYYNDEQDTDYGPDYGNNLGVLLLGTPPSLKAIDGAHIEKQPSTTKKSVNLNYNNDDVFGSNLSVTGYYRDEQGRFYPSAKDGRKQAREVLLESGVDKDTAKELAADATYVMQSEADIEVMGLRAAMQTETELADKPVLLSYGADFERENSEQTYHGQDYTQFEDSNGLVSKANDMTYNGGPDTTIDKIGAFVNSDIDITDKWHASAGVRYQKLKSKTDTFTPFYEQLLQEYFDGSSTDYQAGDVAKGKTDHDKTLFNLGSSYQLTPNDQIFANFSQGFTTADIQRALRDVRAGFVVNSDNVQPIAINNYDLGWQGKRGDTSARVTGFYNTSDKTVRFTNDYTVEVVDTDERVYGVEGSLTQDISDNWQVGGSVAYTRGQYKKDGDWLELDAVRLTPLKGTAFAQYNFDEGSNIRLQALAIGGDDRAFKDQQNDPDASAQPVTGYMTLDVLGQVKMPVGRVGYGVYNVLNKDYQTVYHQTTFGDLNRLPATGTTYGLSYTVDY
ncbi:MULTISPECIES: TonB-dependent receptor [Psychrobacter]|uniref:TonB-dependent receptor n=1 Tax=Psychrobacter alimentarius TaxID=261164 RepID=A0ABM5ZXL6_9GAMM|nr:MULTISPECIES: TonB-dependent receptor [Psychrobacter]AMT96835.1 TonB-dependent receptor [Psychrobacter alimentarius]QCB30801.1 TonB-dependent receptor [Psychrobacter sp. PAMC27889]